ncbi:MAG: DUF378 domain-containing protein [Chlamydiota bacterium]
MKRCLSVLCFLLVIVGALNWGLWGFFQFDLVAWIFHGNTQPLSRLVYAIIGLAAVWILGFSCRCMKGCCCCAECCSDKNKKGGGCCK